MPRFVLSLMFVLFLAFPASAQPYAGDYHHVYCGFEQATGTVDSLNGWSRVNCPFELHGMEYVTLYSVFPAPITSTPWVTLTGDASLGYGGGYVNECIRSEHLHVVNEDRTNFVKVKVFSSCPYDAYLVLRVRVREP